MNRVYDQSARLHNPSYRDVPESPETARYGRLMLHERQRAVASRRRVILCASAVLVVGWCVIALVADALANLISSI